ncbi:phosphoenolpyruvate-protein kinase (PTS system EI component) [Acholeplasma morum]|nr:phosphoenolpyruvate-protein kinase (PTS system EI component) [Paracholeplasma morum]
MYIRNSNGIGLYRSEFLYYELGRFPTVEEQVMIFDNLLRSFYPKPVVIRTYDFGEDKTPIGMHIETRGVASYILHLKDDFVNQIKALLISHSRYDNLRIMIPMVFQKDDLDVFKKILDGVQEDLKLTSEQPKVGVMIETKEAFNHLEDFATADFISIGTNDLGNSLFGYGRDQSVDRSRYVESLCEAIDVISLFAREKQIGCTICGDIASQKDGFLRLLKQGETNFSIAIPFLKEAKQLINQDK